MTGFKWSAIGEISTHGISFVLGLVIARLLMPEDFGAPEADREDSRPGASHGGPGGTRLGITAPDIM